jgi:hypothetical protein
MLERTAFVDAWKIPPSPYHSPVNNLFLRLFLPM